MMYFNLEQLDDQRTTTALVCRLSSVINGLSIMTGNVPDMTTIGKGRVQIPHNNHMHMQKSLDTNTSCTSSMNIPPKPSKACNLPIASENSLPTARSTVVRINKEPKKSEILLLKTPYGIPTFLRQRS